MKDERVIPPFPLGFFFYIDLLLIIEVSGMAIRVYIKDRNLCVILDLQMTLNSAVSWVYQVLVPFTTLINVKQ